MIRSRGRRFAFYGQNGEDYLLWSFFGFRSKGCFLDVGAYDGVTISNTLSFEEQGWSGVCVEANPMVAAECKLRRKHVVHAACVSVPQTQIEICVDRSGLFGGLKVDEKLAQSVYERTGAGDPNFRNITVPAVTASTVLSGFPPVDFVSIDVEGAEIDVLRGLDLAVIRPRVLLVEANTSPEKKALDTFLKPYGYQCARTLGGFNHFYVRSRRDAICIRGITVDCEITNAQTPFYSLAKIQDRIWSAPETRTKLGFFIAKVRHRFQRWKWLP